MKLIIVESPTKCKTLERFLGKEYQIAATMGHVRNLPQKKLGVNIEKDFRPTYVLIAKRKKTVQAIKELANRASKIILATDMDREGEAIAWHISQVLRPGNSKFQIPKFQRIVFHEITREAIEEALKNPRDIDMQLVHAQEARRILDRLVGYQLSPFLWRKIAKGLSAGRVQSPTVRLIVEREREIEAFKPQEYWTIEAMLQPLVIATPTLVRGSNPKQIKKEIASSSLTKILWGTAGNDSKAVNSKCQTFLAKLHKIDDKVLEKLAIRSEKEAAKILQDLEGKTYVVKDIQKKEKNLSPAPPFTTSTLQQEANKRLNFTTRRTMRAAQELYEGVELDKKGPIGLCVDADTLTIDSTGQIYSIKELENKKNVNLMAINDSNLQAKSSSVYKFWKLPAPKKMIELITDSNEKLLITADHPLMVIREGKPVWIQGKNLTSSDYLAVMEKINVKRLKRPSTLLEIIKELPQKAQKQIFFKFSENFFTSPMILNFKNKKNVINYPYLMKLLEKQAISYNFIKKYYQGISYSISPGVKFQKINLEFSPELAYLLGFFVGDGHLEPGRPFLSFGCKCDSKTTLSKLNRLFAKTLSEKFIKLNSNKICYRLNSTFLYLLFQYLGAPAGKKYNKIFIPNILLKQPENILKAYLAGLWDTDGSILPNYKMNSIKLTYSSKSEIFIDKLRLLLKTFSINSSKHGDKRRGVFSLLVSSKGTNNFKTHIAPYLIIKKDIWNTLYRKSKKLSKSPITWEKIKSIKQIPYMKDYVYDVSTDTHSFIANGIVSHNCTYMRTDSFFLSNNFLQDAQNFIKKNFGLNYSPGQSRKFKIRSKLVQAAHEAIRPTLASRQPEEIKKHLTKDQYKLYDLIWRRAIASQMAKARTLASTVDIDAQNDKGETRHQFKATGSQILFDGFLRVWPTKSQDSILPELKIKEKLKLVKIEPLQHFTQPPPRYSEASLVKILEELGIGRPSTYAPIISTVQQRGYVEKEKGKFKPTEVGILVNDLLVEHFSNIVDYQFTAQLEEKLDRIARGEISRTNVLKEFYQPFKENLKAKDKEVSKNQFEEKTNEICEKCGRPMVIKLGRYGKFLACSGFPECKNTKRLPEAKTDVPCPKCGRGEIVEKKSRKGKTFYACNRWPKCDFVLWQKPTGEKCPKCKSLLIEAGKKIRCSNKECDYQKKLEAKGSDPSRKF